MKMFNHMEMSLNRREHIEYLNLLIKTLCFSSRPGRPPKRNSTQQIDDCLDDKRIKLSSNLLLRSFPEFANQGKNKKKFCRKRKCLFV